MLSARNSYCGVGGQLLSRAAWCSWVPCTSCRNTRSVDNVRTASRSSGRMKRRLNGVKPLWVFTVRMCSRCTGGRAALRSCASGCVTGCLLSGLGFQAFGQSQFFQQAPRVVGRAHLDVIVEVAIQIAGLKRLVALIADQVGIGGFTTLGPGF